MSEILTGKQVLALLAQDEVPEIECRLKDGEWNVFNEDDWNVSLLRTTTAWEFRIKPAPQRRLSVTLANGEVVSWPEPVREALEDGQVFFMVRADCLVVDTHWRGSVYDLDLLAYGSVHLTKAAAQEHAAALRKINTQGVVSSR